MHKRTIRRRYKSHRKTAFFIIVLLFVFWFTHCVKLVDSTLQTTIQTMAKYQMETAATQALNQAIQEVLSERNDLYEELVIWEKDKDGRILAVKANSSHVTALKTEIVYKVLQKMQEITPNSIRIPTGTLSGIPFFSGLGPSITLHILPQGSVSAQMENIFTHAGINQTHHEIWIHITVDMAAVIPGYNIETSVTSDFSVAETIFMGDTPSVYAGVNGTDTPFVVAIPSTEEE